MKLTKNFLLSIFLTSTALIGMEFKEEKQEDEKEEEVSTTLMRQFEKEKKEEKEDEKEEEISTTLMEKFRKDQAIFRNPNDESLEFIARGIQSVISSVEKAQTEKPAISFTCEGDSFKINRKGILTLTYSRKELLKKELYSNSISSYLKNENTDIARLISEFLKPAYFTEQGILEELVETNKIDIKKPGPYSQLKIFTENPKSSKVEVLKPFSINEKDLKSTDKTLLYRILSIIVFHGEEFDERRSSNLDIYGKIN